MTEDNNIRNVDDVLKAHVGHEVALFYGYVNETIMRSAVGFLREVKDDLIVMELAEKDRWFNRPKDRLFYLNRRAAVLGSITVLDVVLVDEESEGGR